MINLGKITRRVGYSVAFLAANAFSAAAFGQGSVNPSEPDSLGAGLPSPVLAPSTLQETVGAEGETGNPRLDRPLAPTGTVPDSSYTPDDGFLFYPGVGSESEVGEERLDIKRWRIRPLAAAGVAYDDNIFISHKDRASDVIFNLSGGFAFDLGDYRERVESYLRAEYLATGFLYADHSAQNAVNQDASLFAQYRSGKLTSQFDSHYLYLTGGDRDVGNFARRHVLDNAVRFLYDYSDKTKADLEFRQLSNVYENYLSSYEYTLKFGASYQVTGKTSLGLEGRLGILDIEESPRQFYQQARIRGRYEATGKLTAIGTLGLDVREYSSGGKGAKVTSVFSLGAEYRPLENTFLSLEGYRNINPSASLEGQDYVSTGVVVSAKQLVFQRFSVGTAAGYEHDAYRSNRTGIDANRTDNYFFLRPSASFSICRWLDTSLFYEYRRNASDDAKDSFYNNRVGLEVTAQF